MQDTVGEYYNSQILILEAALKRINKAFSYFYVIRLFTFISFATFLVLFFQFEYNSLFLIFSIICIVWFLFAVKFDLNYHKKERFVSNKLLVNQNELKFLDHQYDQRETGEEFNHLNPHLAADFDLFGKGSLFQYLNRCSTKIGKARFAEGLCRSQIDEKIIEEKQQAIRELSGKNEFIQNFQTHGMIISENGNELDSLQAWLDQTPEKIKLLLVLCVLIPLINFGWIAMTVFEVFTLNSVLIPVFINFFIIYLNLRKINKAHSLLSKTAETFEKYTDLIKLVEAEDFKSAYLSGIKNRLFYQNSNASESLTSLFKLLHSFDFRLNIFASIILNVLLLFDIQIYCRLTKWKKRHKHAVSSWFDALSDIDALTGLSVFAFNNQNAVT